MKLKEILVALAAALTTTLLIQYFFSGRAPNVTQQEQEGAAQSGQRFMAPRSTEVQVHKPLNTEIDFVDTKATRKAEITHIETPIANYEFSTDGAILARVDFKRLLAGKPRLMSTIFPPAQTERERGCFLVALDEKTPYYFDLIEYKPENDHHTIRYKAAVDSGTLFKTFTVYNDTYRVDLEIRFEGMQTALMPRIFFPSPFVPELEGQDTINGITNDQRGTLQVLPKNDETLSSYWANPTLFGTQDRYFVHAMVKDPEQFAKRGFYQTVDLEHMYSILEGPAVNQLQRWMLSFYMGPKEDDAMNKVDPRLEQTLNYGWFSFISKPFSKILLESLNFFYRFVHNYGIAIILLTILLKLLMLPFTWRGEQSMKKRLEFQKKLEYMQQKYKHDNEALAHARAELIRKHGMPGMAGCLPLLLQLPIFWGLSIVLANAVELYKAPFLWIPDLTARDPYFILPILTAIAMILHAPQVDDPKQRISSIAMALVVGAVIANLSAGLAIFILVSTLLGVLQAYIVKWLKIS